MKSSTSMALLKEARPKQWLKNVLVFAAPGAAGMLDNGRPFAKALLIFISFCLASSGTYFWNDILDVEEDRNHPKKRKRPIAAGLITLPIARVLGSMLLVLGVVLATAVRAQAGAVILGYVVLTLSYSSVWKHIAVVDLVAVASGFVLRAVAGATGVDVPMSTWFLLCACFGALFIVTGKRYAELHEMGDKATTTRSTLKVYTPNYLRLVLGMALSATMLAYCLWAFETAADSTASVPWYEITIVPMGIALLRYLLVIENGEGSAPEEVFLKDRILQAVGVVWAVLFAIAVYAN